MTKENDMQEKVFNHDKAGISDKIAFIGELEHLRRHALRSAQATKGTEKSFKHLIHATQAQTIRRKFTGKNFPGISNDDWCKCKVAASLRQLSYELFSGDEELLKEVDDLVDDIWGEALGADLSDCEACRADREEQEKMVADRGVERPLASL